MAQRIREEDCAGARRRCSLLLWRRDEDSMVDDVAQHTTSVGTAVDNAPGPFGPSRRCSGSALADDLAWGQPHALRHIHGPHTRPPTIRRSAVSSRPPAGCVPFIRDVAHQSEVAHRDGGVGGCLDLGSSLGYQVASYLESRHVGERLARRDISRLEFNRSRHRHGNRDQRRPVVRAEHDAWDQQVRRPASEQFRSGLAERGRGDRVVLTGQRQSGRVQLG